MALSVIGNLVVEVTQDNPQPKTESVREIMECGAAYVGGSNKPSILALAKAGVYDGIDFINMKDFFMFGRVRQTDVPLAAGVDKLPLPGNYFAIDEVQVVDIATNEVVRRMEYRDWNNFNVENQRQNLKGVPHHWTVFNSFDDGEIVFYPVPSADEAGVYAIRFSIYERIEVPNNEADAINCPREMNSVLCWYVKWWCATHQKGADDPKAMAAWQHFEMRLNRFETSVNKKPQVRNQETIAIDVNRSMRRGFWRRGWRQYP